MRSILQMKLNHFRVFYDISLKQKEVTSVSNGAELDALLLKKDAVIIKIKELDTQIESLINRNPHGGLILSNDTPIKSYIQQIKELIDKIAPIEKKITEILIRQKNVTKEQLKAIQKRKVIITGYSGPQARTPKFVDYKLE